MLRTGGLRAPGLTLAPSAKVFELPNMTAWAAFFKVRSGENNPLTVHPKNLGIRTLFQGLFYRLFITLDSKSESLRGTLHPKKS